MTAPLKYDAAWLASQTDLREVLKVWRATTTELAAAEERGERELAIDIAEFEVRCARRVGQLIVERRKTKEAWLAAARLEFVPSTRQNCTICGKFKQVTHAHHIEPLAVQYDRGAEYANHEHVWLCPTHHAILHALIDPPPCETDKQLRAYGRSAGEAIADISNDEFYALIDLMPSRWGKSP